MSTEFDQHFVHKADHVDLYLDLKTKGDVRVELSESPGHASLHLRASHTVDFALVDAHLQDGVLKVDVPPLLSPDAPGPAFAFAAGDFSITRGSTVTVDALVTLPSGSNVTIRTGAGDVLVQGSAGHVTVKTGSGDISVDDCVDVQATTGSGDLRIATTSAGGELTTGSGDVSAQPCPGRLKVRTGTGDVRVGTSGQDSHVTVETGSGDVMARVAGGTFEARTGTGDVLVSVREGLPVWLDLSAPLGDITQGLDSHGAPAEAENYASVTVRTGTGDITVTQFARSGGEVTTD